MDKAKWLQKTHLLRADEYICPVCGTAFYGTAGDSTWVDEAEAFYPSGFFGPALHSQAE